MIFHRPATAYLERAMNHHLSKARDKSRPKWIRDMNRLQAGQLEAVIKNDIRKAIMCGGWFDTT